MFRALSERGLLLFALVAMGTLRTNASSVSVDPGTKLQSQKFPFKIGEVNFFSGVEGASPCPAPWIRWGEGACWVLRNRTVHYLVLQRRMLASLLQL